MQSRKSYAHVYLEPPASPQIEPRGALMDVETWLRKLDLGQYGSAFRENKIDRDALRALTDSDLRKLGLPAAHRKRLLRAIRGLRVELPTPPKPVPVTHELRDDVAQRRQLTLMFCDLVGSTAIGAHLDPEDLEEVMHAYRVVCRRVVAAYEGYVARFIGDGMLAYFGYPQADEDAAERAVSAGLDLVTAVGKVNTPIGEPLAVRVAVATGMVVVGDLDGDGALEAVGNTPNLAARLQNCAEPCAVVLEASTRRLLGTGFALRGLGRLELKGFAEPVAAWVVEGKAASESRFQVARSASLTGFVDREQEMDLLIARKAMAWGGEGQLALISGEPGIGKSRLAALLGEELKAEPHTRLLYQCSPHHTNSALHPFIEQLKRAAEFEPNDSPERQLDKLQGVIASAKPRVASAAQFLSVLLSLPIANRDTLSRLSPQHRRRQTLAALLALLEGFANQRPLLLIVEDVHWADATSHELFDLIVESIRRLPILAIFTHRPEFESPWSRLPNVISLALRALEPAHVHAMVGHVTSGRHLPTEVLDQILAKTDGVPLFIEEFTKNLLESGLVHERDGRYVLSEALPARALPSTLQDSLLARLDRLGGAVKETAQVAAVVGREFVYAQLEAVCSLPRQQLRFALTSLVRAGLLREEGSPPDTRYVFKHALIADTAYSTLLRGRRRELHGCIGLTLQKRFPAIADAQPELIAHHMTEGGSSRSAVDWWERAGLQALSRGAYPEATKHFGRAVELLGTLPENQERDRRELAIRMRLRMPLLIAKGYGTAEADPNYARLEDLAQSLAATGEMLSVLNGRCLVSNTRCDFTTAMGHAARLIDLARRHADDNGIAVGHYHLAYNSLVRGELSAARANIGYASTHCKLELSELCRERYNFEVGPALASLHCLILQQSGFLGQAASLAVKTLADAKRNPNAPTQFIVFRNLAFFYLIQRNASEVEQLGTELEKLADQHGGVEWHTHAERCSAWVRANSGRAEQNTRPTAAKTAEASSTRLMQPIYLLQEAELLIKNERCHEALPRLRLAHSLIEETGQRFFKPEADRLQAVARSGDPKAAREVATCFASALELARQFDMKLWELRVAVSCAEYWRDRGRQREAQQLLKPICHWFIEDADTAELMQARTLLDSLN
jgi:class 3 adenylate cyclase